MSGPTQRTFTADPALWDAVTRAAERAGMSTSEWIREALRQRLADADPRGVPAGAGLKAGRPYPKEAQTANTPKGSGGVRK